MKKRIELLLHEVEQNKSLLDSAELALTGMCNLVLPMVRAQDWKSAEDLLNEFKAQGPQFALAIYSGTASRIAAKGAGTTG